ncbi:hypothetical protein CBS147333_9068 [Penicillium roqueforti]|nr:hypothetical protein CBS147333_9068 [Penicillium roqueforti]KAI3196683.1 hypothetical protein CBS147311_7287 [Penicillium roqueforti]KAI3262400.1 hypothetical protein CBS147308_9201 [Penicillium roqueforti]KAI3281232.1 hypothetical protein DTO003C3_9039 [Penicillium roqueforti]
MNLEPIDNLLWQGRRDVAKDVPGSSQRRKQSRFVDIRFENASGVKWYRIGFRISVPVELPWDTKTLSFAIGREMVGVTGVMPRVLCGFKSIIPCVLMGAHDLPEDVSWSLHGDS